jgi:hypothetical protein
LLASQSQSSNSTLPPTSLSNLSLFLWILKLPRKPFSVCKITQSLNSKITPTPSQSSMLPLVNSFLSACTLPSQNTTEFTLEQSTQTATQLLRPNTTCTIKETTAGKQAGATKDFSSQTPQTLLESCPKTAERMPPSTDICTPRASRITTLQHRLAVPHDQAK